MYFNQLLKLKCEHYFSAFSTSMIIQGRVLNQIKFALLQYPFSKSFYLILLDPVHHMLKNYAQENGVQTQTEALKSRPFQSTFHHDHFHQIQCSSALCLIRRKQNITCIKHSHADMSWKVVLELILNYLRQYLVFLWLTSIVFMYITVEEKWNSNSRHLRLWHYSSCHRWKNESSWNPELQQQGPDKTKSTF